MKKELLAIFNTLRIALNFPAIAEDKHEEFSIEKEFIEKAQAAVDNSSALTAQVAQLTTDLGIAKLDIENGKSVLAAEQTAHQATKDLLACEQAAHAALKATAAAATGTVQTEADKQGDEKPAYNVTSYDIAAQKARAEGKI